MKETSLKNLLKRVHENEDGAATIETILIIAAIALPILVVLITVVTPRIMAYLKKAQGDLEGGADAVAAGS